MPDLTDATRKNITVQGVILSAALPYDEGHTLTAQEATSLNQTWLENLRNNFAGAVKTAIEKVKGIENLTEAALGELQKDFNAYQDGYEFGVRGGGREAMDPVFSQAIKLAVAKVKEALKTKGHKLSEVGAEKIRELAGQAVEKNPAFMERARKIVEETQAAADSLAVDVG
jgi:hypothetical protein